MKGLGWRKKEQAERPRAFVASVQCLLTPVCEGQRKKYCSLEAVPVGADRDGAADS